MCMKPASHCSVQRSAVSVQHAVHIAPHFHPAISVDRLALVFSAHTSLYVFVLWIETNAQMTPKVVPKSVYIGHTSQRATSSAVCAVQSFPTARPASVTCTVVWERTPTAPVHFTEYLIRLSQCATRRAGGVTV